jgi:hypothetical protein
VCVLAALATSAGGAAGAGGAIAPGAHARDLQAAADGASCPHLGAPALASDPRAHSLRVFAIQFGQHPAQIVDGAVYRHAIDCVMRTEVAPHLANGRANLVVFDEDIGLETIAAGPRGARARALLRTSRRQGGVRGRAT